MQRALALLESTKNRALVRLWSQWWCCETERERASKVEAFHRRPSGEVVGPFDSLASTWNENPWPVQLVSTATVNALVDRGYLKLKRGKRERAELI
jgi:hypothetical protein